MQQFVAVAVLRAVECGLPLVRAASHGQAASAPSSKGAPGGPAKTTGNDQGPGFFAEVPWQGLYTAGRGLLP